jgi:hypothetical protein
MGPTVVTSLADAISLIAAMHFLDVSKNRIDADGAQALLQAIQSSKLQTIVIGMKDPISISVGGSDTVAAMTALNYSNQDIGPGELMMISSLIIPFSAAVNLINVMKNPIGDDGLAALMVAIKGTAVKTITGLVEGQTSIDYSNQGLKPMDVKTLATDIEFSPVSAVLSEINLSGAAIEEGDLAALRSAAPNVSIVFDDD